MTAVEESGTRWGLSYEEVQSRRRALEDVKADVKVCSAELAVARLAHYTSIALLQKMLQSITDDQSSPSTLAPNQTNGKHRGSDPFSDVELGHASNTGNRPRNDNNAYSDDPYAERRSDEVDDYEMEQQQVRHSHRKTQERLTGAASQIMLQQQDTAVYRISNTLTTLAQQAGLIGQEVMVQNE